MYLVEYDMQHREAINNYCLTDAMIYFTSEPKENVSISETKRTYHSIVCYANKKLVTFFVLDESSAKSIYTNEPNAMLLRAFSTDTRYTRKGHAKEALTLLPDFVKQQYPHIKEIVLAVNSKNNAAQKLYLNANFSDTGKKARGEKGELLIFNYKII
ncbi:MAG: GNAT family N-acetyltransferase [Enterococcus sp.]